MNFLINSELFSSGQFFSNQSLCALSAFQISSAHVISYIFCSPKALAHYLKLLDADDVKFNEYFWWRSFYARRFRHHQAICEVCQKLHTDKEHKIYDNMHDWWVNQAKCSSNHIISQDDMI